MTDATGTITAVDGEYAIVRIDSGGCGRCHEPGGCGATNLGKMFCATPQTFRVLNSGQRVVGDRATITIADGAVRRSALLAYGIPLLALFFGAFAGSALGGDAGAIGGAIGGLFVAWLGLRCLARREQHDQRLEPFIRN